MVKTPTWDAASLKAKREKDELSAEMLAKMLGTKKGNIYKWEKGVVRPHSKGMSKKVQGYINGIKPEPAKKKVQKKPNGAVKKDDFKEKFQIVDAKYHALLEEHVNLLREIVMLKKE